MDYEIFKQEFYNLSDINLSMYKEKQMKRRIDSFIVKENFNGYKDYIKEIKVNKNLFNQFVNYLTINVSEFYRNPEQWRVFEDEFLPAYLNKDTELKIWSSACSTGDEPYTLAMIVSKYMPVGRFKILSTDIDLSALQKAKEGIYSIKSLKSLPQEYLKKHFIKEGENYKIKDELKKSIEFRQLNLLTDDYPKDMDIIVCRNVLIYFTEEAKAEIYKKFNKALKKDGTLFIGNTEQIIMSDRYKFKPVKTFFYKKINAV